MKRTVAFLTILVLFASCAPSPKAIQKAVEKTMTALPTSTATSTQTPVPTSTPTPTQIPLSQIDLNTFILKPEVFSEGYILGDVHPIENDQFTNLTNRGVNSVFQEFTTGKGDKGSYAIILYDQKSDALNSYQEEIAEFSKDSTSFDLSDFGEVAIYNVETYQFAKITISIIIFVQCNALIRVALLTGNLQDIKQIAFNLDKQMELLPCRN